MKQILKKFSTLIILVVLVVIFSVASPNFLRVNNLLNVLRQVAVIGILDGWHDLCYHIRRYGFDSGRLSRSFRCCSCTVDQCRRSGTGSGDSDNSADDCDGIVTGALIVRPKCICNCNYPWNDDRCSGTCLYFFRRTSSV